MSGCGWRGWVGFIAFFYYIDLYICWILSYVHYHICICEKINTIIFVDHETNYNLIYVSYAFIHILYLYSSSHGNDKLILIALYFLLLLPDKIYTCLPFILTHFAPLSSFH